MIVVDLLFVAVLCLVLVVLSSIVVSAYEVGQSKKREQVREESIAKLRIELDEKQKLLDFNDKLNKK